LDTKHWAIMKATAELLRPIYPSTGDDDVHTTNSVRVLYPGSYCHLTASMLFHHVHYVDFDSKVVEMMRSPAVATTWMEEHGMKGGSFTVTKASYEDFFNAKKKTKQRQQPKYRSGCQPPYHLIISMSAGLVTDAIGSTTWWMEDDDGGVEPSPPWLLVSDAHADARRAFVHHADIWELKAVWKEGEWNQDSATLDACFRVIPKKTRGAKRKASNKTDTKSSSSSRKKTPGTTTRDDDQSLDAAEEVHPLMTKDQVEESVRVGSVSKRSFRMVLDATFYLFQRREKK